MAKGRVFTRRPGAKRKLVWATFQYSSASLASGAQDLENMLGNFETALGADLVGATVTRVVGEYGWWVSQPGTIINRYQVGWLLINEGVHHQHHIRLEVGQDTLKAGHDPGSLLSVRGAADFQIDARPGDAQFVEEQAAHILVVMLSGVNQRRLDGGEFPIRLHQRGDLHKVRSCTNDVDYLSHGFESRVIATKDHNRRALDRLHDILIDRKRVVRAPEQPDVATQARAVERRLARATLYPPGHRMSPQHHEPPERPCDHPIVP